MAPHIALEEIGCAFELTLILSRGEREGAMTATDEWRAINPKGRIPALLNVAGNMGGAPSLLTEVPAIMFYLASEHPHAQLLPDGTAPMSRCLEWMNWLASHVHAMSYGQIWRPRRFSDDERHFEAISARGRQNLLEQYAYIERVLDDGRDWSVPQRYSIVDPYLLVFFQWGQRIGLQMRSEYPAWSRLTDRLLQRPAVERVLQREGVAIG